jgi:CheY-like chemotaxis protein
LLTPIGGYAEMLVSKLDGSEQAQHAREIQRAAGRAARLVSQLLSFARGQPGDEPRVDLNQTVTDMLSLLRTLVGARVDLEVGLARMLPRVSLSQDELDRILLNLVANARDALPRGGRIRVVTRSENDPDAIARGEPGSVVLRVEDDGVGISESARERLFDPFFTTKDIGVGTGLGLATVYDIVQKAGGQIRVDSELGVGSTFEIVLPALPGELVRAEISPAPREVRQGSERLLLVEDEVSVRGLVRRLLEQRGYAVIEAGDPETALQLVRGDEGVIDLLLTDLSMPGASGTELARAFRKLRPGVPVLIMTGNPNDELLDALDKEGGQVLAKPFSAAGLCASVRSCIDSHPLRGLPETTALAAG